MRYRGLGFGPALVAAPPSDGLRRGGRGHRVRARLVDLEIPVEARHVEQGAHAGIGCHDREPATAVPAQVVESIHQARQRARIQERGLREVDDQARASRADGAEKAALERGPRLHVDLPRDVDDGRVVVASHIEDREFLALLHFRHLLVPLQRVRKTQFCEGSSGIRASSAYWPPLRASTFAQRVSGSSEKTSAGSAGSTIQSSRPSSSSSCPGPQPAYPAKTRMLPAPSMTSASSPRPGTRTTSPNTGSSASATSARTTPEVGWTGPPAKIGAAGPMSGSRSGAASATVIALGRLRMTPIAPSSPWSATSTTVRRKLGSSSCGPAIRSEPRSDSATASELRRESRVVFVFAEEPHHRLRVLLEARQAQAVALEQRGGAARVVADR